MSIRNIIDQGCYDAADAANAVLSANGIKREMDGGALFLLVSHNDCDYNLSDFIDKYVPRDHAARPSVWAAMRDAMLAADEWFDDFVDSGSEPKVPFEQDEDFGELRTFNVVMEVRDWYEQDVEARCEREALAIAASIADNASGWSPCGGEWDAIGFEIGYGFGDEGAEDEGAEDLTAVDDAEYTALQAAKLEACCAAYRAASAILDDDSVGWPLASLFEHLEDCGNASTWLDLVQDPRCAREQTSRRVIVLAMRKELEVGGVYGGVPVEKLYDASIWEYDDDDGEEIPTGDLHKIVIVVWSDKSVDGMTLDEIGYEANDGDMRGWVESQEILSRTLAPLDPDWDDDNNDFFQMTEERGDRYADERIEYLKKDRPLSIPESPAPRLLGKILALRTRVTEHLDANNGDANDTVDDLMDQLLTAIDELKPHVLTRVGDDMLMSLLELPAPPEEEDEDEEEDDLDAEELLAREKVRACQDAVRQAGALLEIDYPSDTSELHTWISRENNASTWLDNGIHRWHSAARLCRTAVVCVMFESMKEFYGLEIWSPEDQDRIRNGSGT
jgi:hypothetical protein